MIDLHALRQDIANGGDRDLYRGIRKQLRFPVPLDPAINQCFMRLAGTIARLFPDRTRTAIQNPYDARVVVMEFCNDGDTTRADILRVLDAQVSADAAEEIIEESRRHSLGDTTIDELIKEGRRG